MHCLVIKSIGLPEKSLNSLVLQYISKWSFLRINVLLHRYTGYIKISFYVSVTQSFEIYVLLGFANLR